MIHDIIDSVHHYCTWFNWIRKFSWSKIKLSRVNSRGRIDIPTPWYTIAKQASRDNNMLGLSWAKLSQNWDWTEIKIHYIELINKIEWSVLPSSVQVGKFSTSPIGNWDWSYNHSETHPPRTSIFQVPRKLKFGMQAIITKGAKISSCRHKQRMLLIPPKKRKPGWINQDLRKHK